MNNTFVKLYVKSRNLVHSELGQDLVEYGLLCSLIALSMIASINHIATTISNTFSNISSSLS
jgi:Flp pilus assembly pilin Flp